MAYLIKVSIIIMLFYLCYKFLLNRETFFESNRLFLLLGLITAFILPLITISKYIIIEPTTFVIDGALLQAQPVAVNNSLDFTTVLIFTYIIGALFFLGRFLFQFGSLATLILNSTKQRVASFIYVMTKNIISPFSFFNWIVFNPNQFNDLELEQVITHEKVHAKQLHSIDILLTELVCIILWFNPLVWFYKKELKQNLEFIADKNAQATSNCKKSYQHLLLKTSVPNYQVALTNNFYNSSIKKRIVMLHKKKSNKRNQLKFLIVLPVLVLFLMSFNTKEIYIQAKTDAKETSTTSKEVETIPSTRNSTKVTTTVNKPVASKPTNETATTNTAVAQDIIAYFIESSFTDSQLDEVVAKLKSHGITLKIKGVKRNGNNEIIAIKIDAKSDSSNANFSISNDSAIKPIKIAYNANNNSISIGNTNQLIHDSNNTFVFSSDEHDGDHEVIENEDKIIIKKGNTVHELKKAHGDKEENVFIISENEGNTYEIIQADTLETDNNIFKLKGNVVIESKDGNGKIFTLKSKENNKVLFVTKDTNGNVKKTIRTDSVNLTFLSKDRNVFKIKSSDENTSNIWIDKEDNNDKSTKKLIGSGDSEIIVNGNNKNPIYIVDGKEVKNEKIKDLNTDKIKSINVIKGESATKKYGDKGKDGVVEISTKDDMNASSIRFSNKNSEKALIIVDGKEVKNKKLKDIDPNTIESVTVLKGESAEKKYGNKGKDGVIEITLKKKKD